MEKSIFIIDDVRSKRINILKFLFAIFVVVIHANLSASFMMGERWLNIFKYTISNVICNVANNGFFLLSSILLYRKAFKWKDNTIKKIKTLFIPYIFLNVIHILIYFLAEIISFTSRILNSSKLISNYQIIDWLYAFGIGSKVPVNDPTWFIRNLIVLNLISVIIKKIIDKYPKLSLVVLIINAIFIKFDWFYLLYPSNLLFWCLGYYIVKYNINVEKFDNSKIILLIYLLLTTCEVALYVLGYSNIFIMKNLIDNVYFCISVIFWYSIFSVNIKGMIQKVFLKYSKYSFSIYIFHAIFIISLHRIALVILPKNTFVLFLIYILLPLITIIITINVSKFMIRFLPNFYSILTGNRSIKDS